MNQYTKNICRIEFLITLACTGRCKHCSEGDHTDCTGFLDGDAAVRLVRRLTEHYRITSLMTFGGEPLLRPDIVCRIHRAARDAGIPKRQVITNGFFSRDTEKIRRTAEELAGSGVNDLLLSVDAFHQETIPLEPVKTFASAYRSAGGFLRTQPAWLVSADADNPYNRRTREILAEFADMGIAANDGNVIFPSGNALKYLREYFEDGNVPVNPYEESPDDLRTVSVDPNGDVTGGNIYRRDILDILTDYAPPR